MSEEFNPKARYKFNRIRVNTQEVRADLRRVKVGLFTLPIEKEVSLSEEDCFSLAASFHNLSPRQRRGVYFGKRTSRNTKEKD